MEPQTKLVAILNKELTSGIALNALAHMTLGLGSSIEKSALRLDNYHDKNGNVYPNISQMPFIILRAKSNEIKKTIEAARTTNIAYGAFLNTMTGGTYKEQLERTSQTSQEELVYYGCVLYGPIDQINALTKKFSLWRDQVQPTPEQA